MICMSLFFFSLFPTAHRRRVPETQHHIYHRYLSKTKGFCIGCCNMDKGSVSITKLFLNKGTINFVNNLLYIHYTLKENQKMPTKSVNSQIHSEMKN